MQRQNKKKLRKDKKENRQAASSEGKNKTGKSNQDVRGEHDNTKKGGVKQNKIHMKMQMHGERGNKRLPMKKRNSNKYD